MQTQNVFSCLASKAEIHFRHSLLTFIASECFSWCLFDNPTAAFYTVLYICYAKKTGGNARLSLLYDYLK